MRKLKIINGSIITPTGILTDAIVYISEGKILDISTSNHGLSDAIEIDAGGKYISPGFIDIHLHGGGGHDFMDNELDGYFEIAKVHARHGTTAMTPTTLSCEKKDLLQTIETFEKAKVKNTDGAAFIGLHIEGPYFAMSQKGAQDPRYIKNPDAAEYKEIIAFAPSLIRWSAAPELPGALEFGKYLKSKNILPAIAHTNAIYEDIVKAIDAGYSHVTHLYSAMSGVTRKNAYRYAGVVESAYLLDDMTVEIIADGVHLPLPLLKLIYKIKGADKIALITDAMRAAGTKEKESILGSKKDGLKVWIEDGVAKMPDRSAFAGSIATADLLVRNMMHIADVPLTDAVKMMTITPARIMNVNNNKGSIEKGKDADIIIFDNDINVNTTIINGNVIWKAN